MKAGMERIRHNLVLILSIPAFILFIRVLFC